MLALILTALVLPVANTWTVDDDGPADFTQISDAVAEAIPGDVLLVEPGTYASFNLDKRVTILGKAGGTHPRVTDQTRVTAESFTLAGLDFDALLISQVAARGRIDDCRVGYTGDYEQQFALEVDACAEIVVSRTSAKGSQAFSQSHPDFGGAGMLINSSNATLVDCSIGGAQGYTPQVSGLPGGDGGTGLFVTYGSHALIVGTDIWGGYEGFSSELPFWGCYDGESGTGLQVIEATAIMRGGWPDFDGSIQAGPVDGACTNDMGWDIVLLAGTLIISGVDFDINNTQYSTGTLIQPNEPEPFVSIEGTDAPGGKREIRIHGPANQPCVLAVGPSPAYVPLVKYTEKLWVSLSGPFWLLPLVTTGQTQPVVLTWQVPTSTVELAGLAIEVQPFFPQLRSKVDPTKAIGCNVAEIIPRF